MLERAHTPRAKLDSYDEASRSADLQLTLQTGTIPS